MPPRGYANDMEHIHRLMHSWWVIVGYYFGVRTPDDFRYEYVWKTTDYKNNQFRFGVLACHDVHINLSPEKGKVYYEVVIGGWNNTQSVIRMGGAHMQEYQETGIVGCQQWRPFWISWTESTIRVGKSDTFTNTFLEWHDQSFVGISHLSFSTGYGSEGFWAFNDDLGECLWLLLLHPSMKRR